MVSSIALFASKEEIENALLEVVKLDLYYILQPS